MSDAFIDGRRFRVLTIADDFTRECLFLVADRSLSGTRLARELDSLITRRGEPKTIVSDNGTEMTSMATLKWCQENQVKRHYIAPASRCRTTSSKVSTAVSATNASTKPCSRRFPKHEMQSPHARRTTTATDPTHRWATSLPTGSQ